VYSLESDHSTILNLFALLLRRIAKNILFALIVLPMIVFINVFETLITGMAEGPLCQYE
jgi:hypothetical protein